MKAKEYAKKFIQMVDDGESSIRVVQCIMTEIMQETGGLVASKGITTDAGLEGVLREQNQKVNALARILEEHYKFPVLKEDAFQLLLKNEYPDFWKAISKKIWY